MRNCCSRASAQESLALATAMKAMVAKDQLIATLFNTKPRNKQHRRWIELKLEAAMQETNNKHKQSKKC